MRLHEPVKNFKCSLYPLGDISQWYGENKELYSKICPTPDTCMVGGHNGIDIVRSWGTELLSVDNGIIADVKQSPTGYGKHIRLISDGGFEFTYGHLSEIKVTLGQRVSRGDIVGLIGNTGFVVSGDTPFWKNNPYAGTHLHLGVRKVTRIMDVLKPASLIYLSNTSDPYRCNVENYNNGTFGFLPLTAEDFETEVDTVKDITDTIAKVQEVADKQTDPTIKSAFAKAVENLLQRLISLVK